MGIHLQLWQATLEVARLHLRSQEGAIRNAMLASTALTQRRHERDEVEEFLVRHQRQYAARQGDALSVRTAGARRTG